MDELLRGLQQQALIGDADAALQFVHAYSRLDPPPLPKPSIYVRFERGRDDVTGPTLGPFEWVQQTYSELRQSPDGETLAYWNEDAGEWFISGGEHDGEFYSDFILYSDEAPEPTAEHNCQAGRTTTGQDGTVEQVWSNAGPFGAGMWTPTGRIWNTTTGEWN